MTAEGYNGGRGLKKRYYTKSLLFLSLKLQLLQLLLGTVPF